jgi:hypothetical protein
LQDELERQIDETYELLKPLALSRQFVERVSSNARICQYVAK